MLPYANKRQSFGTEIGNWYVKGQLRSVLREPSYEHQVTLAEVVRKSYWIELKSDCIHHFPIDLEPNGLPFAVPNQSENGKYNLISAWFNKIPKILLCVYAERRQSLTDSGCNFFQSRLQKENINIFINENTAKS